MIIRKQAETGSNTSADTAWCQTHVCSKEIVLAKEII